MDGLLDLLIKTFPTKAISIWSFREADRRFCRIRSMTIDKESVPLELSHPVILQLQKEDEGVMIEDNPDSLRAAGVALCFPIRTQGRLTAFIALGRPLHGETYGTDDSDLLRGISHHVGALLSHARLAEERQASAELEALHRFSVFCLHDLKNLAARLSLVAQNAERHGHDPAFQESAMRTVTDTAAKMTSLMSKLSRSSVKPGSDRSAGIGGHPRTDRGDCGPHEGRGECAAACGGRAGSAGHRREGPDTSSTAQCDPQCQASNRPGGGHFDRDRGIRRVHHGDGYGYRMWHSFDHAGVVVSAVAIEPAWWSWRGTLPVQADCGSAPGNDRNQESAGTRNSGED